MIIDLDQNLDHGPKTQVISSDPSSHAPHEHPSHREWMIDSSDPWAARFLTPLTNLDADFWENWNAEDVACAMAYFALDTLRILHAGDPNYDEGMARDQCMLAARRAVFDYAGMLTEQDYQQMAVRMRPDDKVRPS
jgi:hypothetical protein